MSVKMVNHASSPNAIGAIHRSVSISTVFVRGSNRVDLEDSNATHHHSSCLIFRIASRDRSAIKYILVFRCKASRSMAVLTTVMASPFSSLMF
ncbi:Protein kinase domain-containing protein [Psidium guajava]|nr:Protein kinase domain-containing protein [Psidium guajava]